MNSIALGCRSLSYDAHLYPASCLGTSGDIHLGATSNMHGLCMTLGMGHGPGQCLLSAKDLHEIEGSARYIHPTEHQHLHGIHTLGFEGHTWELYASLQATRSRPVLSGPQSYTGMTSTNIVHSVCMAQAFGACTCCRLNTGE